MESKQSPNQSVIDELENSKNEVLKRVAEKLKTQLESDSVCSGHSSHTSGPGGRTHNSTTTH